MTCLKEKLNELKCQIDKVIRGLERTPIAAFDADGTIWNTDMGVKFLKYQEKENLLNSKTLWEQYLILYAKDPESAYCWMAQINSGYPLHTIRQWSSDLYEDSPPPIFNFQKKLIEYLNKKQVEIYIVSASVKWAIEPGAKLFGIKSSNVIGVETLIEEDRITNKLYRPIPYKKGKTSRLLQETNGIKPFLVAGNSLGDKDLLETAEIKLVVSAAKPNERNYESEKAMINIAKKRDWFYCQFN